jgi:predicted permease
MRRLFVMFVCVLFFCFIVQVNIPRDVDAKQYAEHTPRAKAGLVAASVVSSAVYLPFKAAYAVLGGITSGLTYSVTLAKEAETANRIAVKSFTGDWYIHPNILTGEEELNFSGPDDVFP